MSINVLLLYILSDNCGELLIYTLLLHTQKKTHKLLYNNFCVFKIAGAARIELALTVLETAVLPLNYAPSSVLCNSSSPTNVILTYRHRFCKYYFYFYLFHNLFFFVSSFLYLFLHDITTHHSFCVTHHCIHNLINFHSGFKCLL